MITFNRKLDFEYGKLEQVAPNIRRVIARNPSAFTFHGTATYVVGEGEVAVIDPGPRDPSHIDALIEGLGNEKITHILVTHTHLDHSPACAILKQHTNAPTFGFGKHGSGRIQQGETVEEGADFDFIPDQHVKHADLINGNGWSFECVHTPGHTSNHICFQHRESKTLFCGDHIMAWATTIISPPDGDLGTYLKSLALLLDRDDSVYRPTHGPAIQNPKPFVKSFIEHRHQRVREVFDCITQGTGNITDMVKLLYKNYPVSIHPAAAHSVLASIVYLMDQGKVVCDGEAGLEKKFNTRDQV